MVPTPTEESPSGGSLSAVPDAAPASSSPPSSPSTNIRSASIQSEDTVSQVMMSPDDDAGCPNVGRMSLLVVE